MINDLSVLRESPFTDCGSVVDLFEDMNVWMGLLSVIDGINSNVIGM